MTRVKELIPSWSRYRGLKSDHSRLRANFAMPTEVRLRVWSRQSIEMEPLS